MGSSFANFFASPLADFKVFALLSSVAVWFQSRVASPMNVEEVSFSLKSPAVALLVVVPFKYICNKQWQTLRDWIDTGKKYYKWVHESMI